MSRSSFLVGLLLILAFASLSAAGFFLLQGRGEAQAVGATAPEATAIATNAAILPTASATLPPTTTPILFNVLLHDGSGERRVLTGADTVADLLADEALVLTGNDRVEPALETPLADQMTVRITRAVPLTVLVDGQTLAIFSSGRSVADVLANTGITVSETDIITPSRKQAVQSGDVITVVRSGEEIVIEEESVPYQTVYQPTDTLDLDTKELLSNGVPGLKRRSVRVRYENGVEVDRQVEGEWIEQEAVNEVIGYGTRITTNVVDTPEGPREYWRVVRMRATAYTAASSGKSPDHPAYGITASGRPAGTGIVAVDPNVIPFRSEVYVPGYGVGFAGDTGGGVKGRWIDLGYDEDELQTWNGYVDVYYLTPVPAEINYLLPEVLP